ncbi:13370_t:CDS:1, partial [Entrophospora sp. SA101]
PIESNFTLEQLVKESLSRTDTKILSKFLAWQTICVNPKNRAAILSNK